MRTPPIIQDYLNVDSAASIQYAGTGISTVPAEDRNAWDVAYEILSRVSTSEDHARVLIKSLFKQLYKNVWTEPFTRQILANVPNFFFMVRFRKMLYIKFTAESE